MSSLSIYAGPTALQQIRREGLKADQFKLFFERALFSNMGQTSPWTALSDLATVVHSLSIENLQEVLDKSKLIAEEFAQLVDTGNGIDNILRFADRDR